MKLFKNWKIETALPWLLVIGGTIGIICSLVLTYDQVQIWRNPHYVPACSLNPLINCGTVIDSNAGHIFGIPGPFFGLLVFPVLITVGAAMLAGAKFKRWFWMGLELGALGGVAYAIWLFWVSLYQVHALCPFCLAVDVVVYTLFWYITQYNLKNKNIVLPGKLRAVGAFAQKYHLDILIFWFVLLIAYTLKHFWYYYGRQIFGS